MNGNNINNLLLSSFKENKSQFIYDLKIFFFLKIIMKKKKIFKETGKSIANPKKKELINRI